MTMKNGTHQNPGAGSLLANDVFGPEFGTAGPRAGAWGSEDCKCADRLENQKQHTFSYLFSIREAEKAQLRELNDRHLLLLSEKQGVINCLLQKIETLTKLK